MSGPVSTDGLIRLHSQPLGCESTSMEEQIRLDSALHKDSLGLTGSQNLSVSTFKAAEVSGKIFKEEDKN